MAYKNKEKEQQNKKEYYQKNKKKILQYKKKYYQRNKKKILQYQKEWGEKNRQRRLQQHRDYYQKNIERIQQRHRKYNQEHKEQRLRYKGKWQKYQRETNPKYRLDENMGTAIWRSLKDKKAGRKWETLVNYTLKELIEHLEKHFNSKMNWNNYGSYWAVDHIKPSSLFNYTSPEDLEFKQCWTLKNLQPLEKIENIKKRNHYID